MVRVSPSDMPSSAWRMVWQGASAVQGLPSLPDVATTRVAAVATSGNRRNGSVRVQRCIEGLLACGPLQVPCGPAGLEYRVGHVSPRRTRSESSHIAVL